MDSLKVAYMERKIRASLQMYGSWTSVDPQLLVKTPSMDMLCDPLAREIATLGWKMRIPAEVLESWKWPASLWQHVKLSCFPKCLLRWFPVEYRSISFARLYDLEAPRNLGYRYIFGSFSDNDKGEEVPVTVSECPTCKKKRMVKEM